ncbi:unnamed protein product [Discula destructiva]
MSGYSLATSYSGQSLIDNFNFVSFQDPTQGFVSYQNYASAAAAGLVVHNASTNAVTLSVDTTNIYPSNGSRGGRPSVRIESKAGVNQGLVIGDFAHMPGSVCGAWPAFWMYGPDWPNGGEIDIIEGANMAYNNLMSAHTSANCALPPLPVGVENPTFTGTQHYTNCADTAYGCNYATPTTDTLSYGSDFNGVGGGVYALQWTGEAIKIWHFPRTKIPMDIVAKQPDPSGWGLPQALFGNGGCGVESHFNDMSIVLNIDFCGTYAGNLWATDAQCSTYAKTCEEWVGNNPSMLTELYWEVNYIDVYSTLVAPEKTPTNNVGLPPTSAPYNGTLVHKPSGAPSASATPAAVTSGRTESDPAEGGAAPTKTAASPSSEISPVDSIVPRHNPDVIDVYSYIGCFASTTGFISFNLSGTSPLLTLEKCVGLCGGKKYAGAVDSMCYCAETLDEGTGAVSDRARCDLPCPGNTAEFCGGSTSPTKRAALFNVLLTMYANINGLNATTPPPAPALGSDTTNNTVSPLSSAGPEYGAVATTTAQQIITSTITYTAVCETNPAQLVTLTYCTTITVCPTSSPSIPQTIVTQSCDSCGKNGSSVVTLTIPVHVAVTKTAYGVATATGYVNKPKPTMTYLPVTAAAPPRVRVPEFLMTLLGFVGMLL